MNETCEIDSVRLAEFGEAREKLWMDWEAGEITTLEYRDSLDQLISHEIAARVAAKLSQPPRQMARRNLVTLVALSGVFLFGLLIGPWVYTKLFGYTSAEECVIATKNKYAFNACYDLYPSVKD